MLPKTCRGHVPASWGPGAGAFLAAGGLAAAGLGLAAGLAAGFFLGGAFFFFGAWQGAARVWCEL